MCNNKFKILVGDYDMSELKGIPESMLIPLAVKARETLSDMPIINDPLYVKIIKEIDNPVLDTYVDWLSQLGISIRTEILDEIVINFIKHANHPFIINIGCGLDTRLSRLKLNNIPWIDIDVPESINLRKRFFNETYFYKMINKSMFDYSWIDDVKRNVHFKEDSDILIIFEGVLMYFEKVEVEAVYKEIARLFDKHHLVIASEFCSKFMTKHTNNHPSVSKLSSKPLFKFGYNNVAELKDILPDSWKVVKEYNYFDRYSHRWRYLKWFKYIVYLKNRFNNKIVIIKNT